jgi:hypothetical protein
MQSGPEVQSPFWRSIALDWFWGREGLEWKGKGGDFFYSDSLRPADRPELGEEEEGTTWQSGGTHIRGERKESNNIRIRT